MQAHRSLKFIVIRNPVMPDDRLILERDYIDGANLHDYIGELNGRYAISRNGLTVDQDELHQDYPMAGDVVVICPILHGGSGGKNIMRLVAVVALTAFTYGGGAAALGSSMGLTTGSVGMGVFTAAVAIGGTMLINAVLPPTVDDLGVSSDSKAPDYTYGIDGAKNTSQDNIPVPLVYGKHRVAGNIIGNYTELQGQTQYLHMLINAGEGVAAGIDVDSILINDQPMSSLADRPEINFYHGNDGQSVPEGFNRQITPIQVENNPELVDPETWTSFTTSVGVEVNAVQVNLNTRIAKLDNQGNELSHSVPIELQIRKHGSSEWLPLTTGIRAVDASRGYILKDVTDENGDRVKFDSTGKTITKKAVGRQYIDPKYPNKYLPNGMYQNYYVKIGHEWVAKGDLVTEDGKTSKPVYYYNRYGNTSDVRYYTGAEPTRTSAPPSYEYGELWCEGRHVGYYHDFHASNKIVNGYNDSGLEGGSKSGQKITLSGESTSANTRFTFESYKLPQGRYEIRARRLTAKSDKSTIQDEIIWNEINEIQNVSIAYNYTALLALKIKVTDQISNIPKVTFEHYGQVIRVWDEKAKAWVPSANKDEIESGFDITVREVEKYGQIRPFTDDEKKQSLKQVSGNSVPCAVAFDKPAHTLAVETPEIYEDGFYQHANPAWIVWDIMTSRRYGAGIHPSRLDFYAFKAWAKFCEEKKLYYRGVISSKANVWDCVSQIFRVGRATPLRMGTRYSVSIEKEKTPVMRFGQDNIIKDTFSTDWLPIDDRANEIELTFYDEENNYAQRTIKISDSDAIQAGAKPNTTSTTMRGVVTLDQATREGIYALNMNKLVQTVSFEAPIEALACTIGDVVTVQHDMMEWGAAGKLEAVTDLGDNEYRARLDQDIVFNSDQEWKMVLSLSQLERGSFVVDNIYGDYLTLRGFDPDTSDRIKRALVRDVDLAVLDTFKSSNGECGIVVNDSSSIVVGDTVSLHDLDVISNIDIVPEQYDSPTNLVAFNLSGAKPEALQGFVVGHVNYESRLFTIRSIGLTGDTLTRTITALEYDPRALRDDTMDFVISDVPVDRPLGPVSDIEIAESDVFGTSSQKIKVVIAWSHADHRYRTSSVSAKVSGEGVKYLGEFHSSAELVCERDRAIEFIIVPRDVADKPGLSTTVQHVPKGMDGNPFTVSDVTLESILGGAKLSWNVMSSNLFATEIYAIETGTIVNGSPVELGSPESWNGEQIIKHASLVSTTLTHHFEHITETDSTVAKPHFYWLRTLDKSGKPSSFVYGGSSAPTTSRAFNTVTVYQWSIEAPSRPTGGSYDNPTPEQSEWTKAPENLASGAPENIKLWSSVRTFCNMEMYQDAEWSVPAASSNDSYQYTWVAYADKPDGSGFSLSKLDSSRFIGHAYNKIDPKPSTNYQDYEWDLILHDEQPIVEIATGAAGAVVNEAVADINLERIEAEEAMAEAGLAALLDTIIERDVTRKETFGPRGTYARIEETRREITDANQSIAEIEQTLTASIQTAKSDLQAQIETNKSAIASTDESLATLDTTLRAMIESGDSSLLAKVNTNSQAVANANSAISTLDTTLRAAIDTAEGELAALINENKTAIANTDSTVANLEETLSSAIESAETSLQSQIDTNKTAIANTNGTVAALETTLRAEMESTAGDLQALIDTNKTAIVDANNSISEVEERLRSEMQMADSTIQAQVSENKTSLTNTNTALSELETTLNAAMNSADSALQSQINTNKTAISNTNASMASLETSLLSELETTKNSLQAQIDSNETAITNANSAIASAKTELRSEFSAADQTISDDLDEAKSLLQSQINSNASAISSANSSIASLEDTLTASINSAKSSLQSQITTNKNAIANTNSSVANIVNKLNASAGSSYASIQEAMQTAVNAEGVYSAQWGVKTSVNGLQGGVGFYNNGSKTQFLVNADTFAVTNKHTDGKTDIVKSMFSVVDGVSYINSAFIDDAYIENLMANYISVTRLDALDIYGSTIEGGIVKSAKFEAGEVEGTNIRGSVITGSAIQASYIAADVQMLVLTWRNQEQYGTMSVETLENQGITPYMAFNIGVSDSDSAQAGQWATLNIASYDYSNKGEYVRYSRRYIQPECVSNKKLTYEKTNTTYSAGTTPSYPPVKDNGAVCKVIISHAGTDTTVTSPRLYDGQSATVGGIKFNVSMTVSKRSSAAELYGSAGYATVEVRHWFDLDGSTVDFRGNKSEFRVRYFIDNVEVGGSVSDTANNATTPTNGGPN